MGGALDFPPRFWPLEKELAFRPGHGGAGREVCDIPEQDEFLVIGQGSASRVHGIDTTGAVDGHVDGLQLGSPVCFGVERIAEVEHPHLAAIAGIIALYRLGARGTSGMVMMGG